MPARDIARMRELAKRLDDLCREASQIREELLKTASQGNEWPQSGRLERVFRKSTLPSEFHPTSTDDPAQQN
jgi:hypothetical protein